MYLAPGKFITHQLKNATKSACAPKQLDASIARSNGASVVNLTKIENYGGRFGRVPDIGYPSDGHPFRYGWSWRRGLLPRFGANLYPL